MFQADAIPDWAVYLLGVPFFPLAGIVHPALGITQVGLLIAAAVWRTVLSNRRAGVRLRLFWLVYLPFLLLPNIGVLIWAVWSDAAL